MMLQETISSLKQTNNRIISFQSLFNQQGFLTLSRSV